MPSRAMGAAVADRLKSFRKMMRNTDATKKLTASSSTGTIHFVKTTTMCISV